MWRHDDDGSGNFEEPPMGDSLDGDYLEAKAKAEAGEGVPPIMQEAASATTASEVVASEELTPEQPFTAQTLLDNSTDFDERIPFHTQANRLNVYARNKTVRDMIEADAKGSRIIAPKEATQLFQRFLVLKLKRGSPIEKAFYANMSIEAFINRLLTQRPITFSAHGELKLRDGRDQTNEEIQARSGQAAFETIGKPGEQAPFVMADYLTPHERLLSSFLGLSTATSCINDGDIGNKGNPGKKDSYEKRATVISVVGQRAEKEGQNEARFIKITRKQNTTENGYGKDADMANEETLILRLFADFYAGLGARLPRDRHGYYFPTYDEAQRQLMPAASTAGTAESTASEAVPSEVSGRRDVRHCSGNVYGSIYSERILGQKENKAGKHIINQDVFRIRQKMAYAMIIREAQARAEMQGKKKVLLRLGGVGLGQWALDQALQAQITLEVIGEVLRECDCSRIAGVELTYFHNPETTQRHSYLESDNLESVVGRTKALIFAGTTNVFAPINRKKYDGLMACHLWDGNSGFGNEYYLGSMQLTGSMDPAVACAMFMELMIPYINTNLCAQKMAVIPTFGRLPPEPLKNMRYLEYPFTQNFIIFLLNPLLSELSQSQGRLRGMFKSGPDVPLLKKLIQFWQEGECPDDPTAIYHYLERFIEVNIKKKVITVTQPVMMALRHIQSVCVDHGAVVPQAMHFFRHSENIRVQLGATLMGLLSGGPSEETLQAKQALPFIMLDKEDGMTISFRGEHADYAEKLTKLLAVLGFKSHVFGSVDENISNEHGTFTHAIRITDHQEVLRLINAVCRYGSVKGFAKNLYQNEKLGEVYEACQGRSRTPSPTGRG